MRKSNLLKLYSIEEDLKENRLKVSFEFNVKSLDLMMNDQYQPKVKEILKLIKNIF